MKEQYVGDVNDYRKYALLRHFAGAGIRIGICWMLTPPDDGPDGGKTAYLKDPERWRHYDPAVFDLLKSVRRSGRATAAGDRAQRCHSRRYVLQRAPDGPR